MDPKLLAILACPVCLAPLRLEGDRLVCTKTQVAYPIEDDIPILLAERAEPAHPDDRSPARESSEQAG